MGRRLTAVLLACVLLFACSGCSLTFPVKEEPPTETEQAPDSTAYLSEFRDRWCYRVLPARLQSLYGALYTAVRECEEDTEFAIRDAEGNDRLYTGIKVTLPEPITDTGDARVVFNAFTTDNPQFFFVGNTYSYEGYRLEEVDYYDTFCLTFVMDAAERRAAQSRLEAEVNALLDAVPSGASDYETELYLHDALIDRVVYDSAAADGTVSAEERPASFSAYGALVDGLAVCEGYSRAMQLLLHRSDIPCTLVSGEASGAAHMWNMAEIDGRNYHLDPTWDDAGNRLQHTFFNLNTAEILLTHTPDDSNLGVDTCTATEANFYLMEGAHLDTYDRSLIAEAVARQVAAGKETVDLRFSEDTFATAQLFIADARRLKQYTNPFLDGEEMWNYICQVNEEHRTLTLHKEI